MSSSTDDVTVTPTYFHRLSAAAGVGPSLGDPWVVRDIYLAAADWQGPRVDPGDVMSLGARAGGGGVRGRGGGAGLLWGNAVGAAAVEKGVLDGVQRQQPAAAAAVADWDEAVNGVFAGPLAANNETLVHADLLLTIFSGTAKASTSERFSCLVSVSGFPVY